MWDYISFWMAKEIAHFFVAVIVVIAIIVVAVASVFYIEYVYWPWKMRRNSLAAQYMYACMLIHFQDGDNAASVQIFVLQNYFPTANDTSRHYNKLARLTIHRLMRDKVIEFNAGAFVLTDKGKSKIEWAHSVRKATFYSRR